MQLLFLQATFVYDCHLYSNHTQEAINFKIFKLNFVYCWRQWRRLGGEGGARVLLLDLREQLSLNGITALNSTEASTKVL